MLRAACLLGEEVALGAFRRHHGRHNFENLSAGQLPFATGHAGDDFEFEILIVPHGEAIVSCQSASSARASCAGPDPS